MTYFQTTFQVSSSDRSPEKRKFVVRTGKFSHTTRHSRAPTKPIQINFTNDCLAKIKIHLPLK